MALGYFVRIRPRDDRVLAPTPAERRVLVRVVLEHGREANLLAFGLADNHLHIEPACSRAVAGETARRMELSLGRLLHVDVGFETARIDPIKDGRHLNNAFRYALGQDRRHGLHNDPLREASNLPDLLGLRGLGRYTAANVRRLLPRIRRPDLLGLLGVTKLEPSDGHVERVFDAALAAAGLARLSSRSKEAVEMKRALVEVIGGRVSSRDLASKLELSERRIRGLKRERPADKKLVLAIRLQLGLMGQLAERELEAGNSPFVPPEEGKGTMLRLAPRPAGSESDHPPAGETHSSESLA